MKHSRTLTITAAFLGLIVSTISIAQTNEKDSQTPKNISVLQTVLGGSTSETGSLIGEATYDRIFTGDVQNDCTATSTASGAGTGVEFAALPISSPTGATLVASLANPGTDIGDTVLSLYCDPFESTTPDLNLVAYNDDAVGLISAFDGSEGAILEPNVTYFLVVSLFSPTDIGGGNFELTVGGLNTGEEVVFGSAVLLPPPPSVPSLSVGGLVVLFAMLGLVAIIVVRRKSAI